MTEGAKGDKGTGSGLGRESWWKNKYGRGRQMGGSMGGVRGRGEMGIRREDVGRGKCEEGHTMRGVEVR